MAPAVVTVARNSIKEQSELHTAGSMMRACMLVRDNGSNCGTQTQDQGIAINTGNESLLIASTVVTPALHCIKARNQAAHCGKHYACMLAGAHGSNGGDQLKP